MLIMMTVRDTAKLHPTFLFASTFSLTHTLSLSLFTYLTHSFTHSHNFNSEIDQSQAKVQRKNTHT